MVCSTGTLSTDWSESLGNRRGIHALLPDGRVTLYPCPMRESWASSESNRRSMLGNRGRDTKPELAVRRLLHAQGFRYRVNFRLERDLRRTADLVFPRARVAVFIDGCYWHGCPEHYTAPATNAPDWQDKVSTNRIREAETTRIPTERGWTVLRFWEHQAANTVADAIAETVAEAAASQNRHEAGPGTVGAPGTRAFGQGPVP